MNVTNKTYEERWNKVEEQMKKLTETCAAITAPAKNQDATTDPAPKDEMLVRKEIYNLEYSKFTINLILD